MHFPVDKKRTAAASSSTRWKSDFSYAERSTKEGLFTLAWQMPSAGLLPQNLMGARLVQQHLQNGVNMSTGANMPSLTWHHFYQTMNHCVKMSGSLLWELALFHIHQTWGCLPNICLRGLIRSCCCWALKLSACISSEERQKFLRKPRGEFCIMAFRKHWLVNRVQLLVDNSPPFPDFQMN